jgi:hypothetical protein
MLFLYTMIWCDKASLSPLHLKEISSQMILFLRPYLVDMFRQMSIAEMSFQKWFGKYCSKASSSQGYKRCHSNYKRSSLGTVAQ